MPIQYTDNLQTLNGDLWYNYHIVLHIHELLYISNCQVYIIRITQTPGEPHF